MRKFFVTITALAVLVAPAVPVPQKATPQQYPPFLCVLFPWACR